MATTNKSNPEAFIEARMFLRQVSEMRRYLTVQEMSTLRGQALSGDLEGAYKGLERLLKRDRMMRGGRTA